MPTRTHDTLHPFSAATPVRNTPPGPRQARTNTNAGCAPDNPRDSTAPHLASSRSHRGPVAAIARHQPGTDLDPSGQQRRPRRGSLAWWISEHQPPASVPVISRRRWLVLLTYWVTTPQGRAALKAARVGQRTFLAVATVIARHCNGSNGRNIAITNERLAEASGRSPETVTRVRTLLRNAQLLHRSAEGVSGGTGCNARPSIDHLTTPRTAVPTESPADTQAAKRTRRAPKRPVDNTIRATAPEAVMPTLSVVTPVGIKTPVNRVVANQKRCAWSTTPNPNKIPTTSRTKTVKPAAQRRRWWLAYQFADTMTARIHGIDHNARSTTASALYRSHLDLEAWHTEGAAPAVIRALDLHAPTTCTGTQTHRWDWPQHITSPGGFLTIRLRHLPARPQLVSTPAPSTAVITKLALGPGSTNAGRQAARTQWMNARAALHAKRRGEREQLASK